MLFALSWHKMVGESGRFSSRSSLTPRLSFPDRFPSLLDYQDSSESGDTDILSENEGIGTDTFRQGKAASSSSQRSRRKK